VAEQRFTDTQRWRRIAAAARQDAASTLDWKSAVVGVIKLMREIPARTAICTAFGML
jgi:hypothetical protein